MILKSFCNSCEVFLKRQALFWVRCQKVNVLQLICYHSLRTVTAFYARKRGALSKRWTERQEWLKRRLVFSLFVGQPILSYVQRGCAVCTQRLPLPSCSPDQLFNCTRPLAITWDPSDIFEGEYISTRVTRVALQMCDGPESTLPPLQEPLLRW